jgi:gluconate kinase
LTLVERRAEASQQILNRTKRRKPHLMKKSLIFIYYNF